MGPLSNRINGMNRTLPGSTSTDLYSKLLSSYIKHLLVELKPATNRAIVHGVLPGCAKKVAEWLRVWVPGSDGLDLNVGSASHSLCDLGQVT